MSAATVRNSVFRRAAFGLGAAAAGAAGVMVAGVSAWQPWVFLIAPDLAVALGMGRGLKPGQLHPRAVPLYNALHVLAGPAVLAVAAWWLGRPWLGAALAWCAHVLFDRAVGFGLRDRAGYIR